jgi:Ser/Thr protein kinase RdoA (MazF antagonist)
MERGPQGCQDVRQRLLFEHRRPHLVEVAAQSEDSRRVQVVCHNDFSPHNLVFRDGRIVAAIDFDFCSTGPRLWDIAYFATRIAPLTATPPHNAPGRMMHVDECT